MTTIPGFTAAASLNRSETQFMLKEIETRSCNETRVVPATWCYERCFNKCIARGYEYDFCTSVCYAFCTRNV